MAKAARSSGRAGIGTGALAPLGPIDAMLAEHDRQRQICERLQKIAYDGRVARDEARAISAYLLRDWQHHRDDESEYLFPMLRRRVLPEDGLIDVLAQLEEEHVRAQALIDGFIRVFETATGDMEQIVPPHVAAAIIRYAAMEHRHLAIENSIVLTIARVRLTRSDLAELADRMRARRRPASGGERQER